MPVFTLGAQSFIYLNRQDVMGGSPEIIRQDVEAFARPGTDGLAIRLNGTKGKPFTVRSCAYAADATAAISGINAYKNLVGASPQVVVWEGIDYSSAFNTKYVVGDVREQEWHSVYGLIVDGSVIGNVLLVYAAWDLIPVEAS